MVTSDRHPLAPDGTASRRHTIFLLGYDNLGWIAFRATAERMSDVEIVGEAREPDQARTSLSALRPALVVIGYPESGFNAVAAMVRACSPESRLLLVTDLISAAVHAVRDYEMLGGCLLWRDLSGDALEAALAAILAGNTVFSRSAIARLRAGRAGAFETVDGRNELTTEELVVLRHLCHGLRQKEIAAEAQLSVRTVSRLATTLQRKLAAASPCQLGARAAELGLLRGPF